MRYILSILILVFGMLVGQVLARGDILQSQSTYSLTFFMVDSTDHISGKTGLSPTVTLSKNGAAFAAPSGAITEIANGWYKVAGNATDTGTLGPLLLHASATGADPSDVVYEVVGIDVHDSVRMGQTALPNANAEAAGGLYTRGSGAGQIRQDANGRIDTNAKAVADSAVASATSGYFPSDAIYWKGGLIPTPPITGVPFVNTAYWNNFSVFHTVAGYPDVFVSGWTGTTLPTTAGPACSTRNGTAQAGAATTITLDASASSTNSIYVNQLVVITAGAGAGQARFITAYVGSTKVATVATWQTNPDNTSKFSIYPFDGIATTAPANLSAGEKTDVENAVLNAALSSHTSAGTLGELLGTALPDIAPGSANGLLRGGTNAATTVNITGNLSGSVGSLTTNNDKTGYALSAGGVQAIWDALTSALTTVGSIGKRLADDVDATTSSRMATFSLPSNFSSFSIDSNGRIDLGLWKGSAPANLSSSYVQVDIESIVANGTTAPSNLKKAFDGATGYGFTACTMPTTTNVTNDVGITQAAADKVWSTTTRALTDKVGFALSAGGVQAIWDAATSALVTAGSIGKLFTDNLNATISSRLPSSSYLETGDPYAYLTANLGSHGAQVTNLDATVSSRLATAGYTAPDNTSIATILTRTDVATSTRLATAGYTAPANADITTILGRVDVATSTRAAAANLTGDPYAYLVSNYGAHGAQATALGDTRLAYLDGAISAVPPGVWNSVLESTGASITAAQWARMDMAALFGNSEGGGTLTLKFFAPDYVFGGTAGPGGGPGTLRFTTTLKDKITYDRKVVVRNP